MFCSEATCLSLYVYIYIYILENDCVYCAVRTEVYTRAAPKVMPPILLCWPTTSVANVVDMAVEVEPSRQYSVKFCCRATDYNRGAV